MMPRWAQKLDAQARPAPTPHDQIRIVKLVMAAAGLCVPVGIASARIAVWIIRRSVLDPRGLAVIVIVALFGLILSGLATTGRTLGVKAASGAILPALAFFGAFLTTLLFEIFS